MYLGRVHFLFSDLFILLECVISFGLLLDSLSLFFILLKKNMNENITFGIYHLINGTIIQHHWSRNRKWILMCDVCLSMCVCVGNLGICYRTRITLSCNWLNIYCHWERYLASIFPGTQWQCNYYSKDIRIWNIQKQNLCKTFKNSYTKELYLEAGILDLRVRITIYLVCLIYTWV